MYSTSILPAISVLYTLAQAKNTVQHAFKLSSLVLPENTCGATLLLNSQNLCLAETHSENHHAHHHAHRFSHSDHSHFHDIDLDELFDTYDNSRRANSWTDISECISSNEKNETYCVYTDANYANGRGISFFTTPSIASQVASLPAFTRPILTPSINAFLTSAPEDLPYEVRPIPGRGNGVFATRKLERGDLIMAETPAGVYMSDAFWPDYDLGYEYLRKTYDWLPEPTKEEFEALSMHKEGHPIMERVNTNAFAGTLGTEEEPHFWVHPRTAMFNHDCRPNAMYHHNPETLIHSTIAATTIEKDEEITITYINLLENHTTRQELLQVWGFTCTCQLCSSSSTKNLASEARISKIQAYQDALGDWTSSSTATPQMAESLLKLYEKEKLWAAWGTGHLYAALAWNAIGEEGEEKAVWHAKRSVELGTLASGAVENNRIEMQKIVDNPREHWSWRYRKD